MIFALGPQLYITHDICPNKVLITILSFTVINNNNVDLDLIPDLNLISYFEQICFS